MPDIVLHALNGKQVKTMKNKESKTLVLRALHWCVTTCFYDRARENITVFPSAIR